MDLIDLAGAVAELRGLLEFIRRKASKGMAGLMGQHVHIRLGPVEVGKDKGRMVQGKGGAVAADPFSFFGLQVKQLVLHHKIKEFPAFRRQLPVHFLGLFHHIVPVSHRNRISLGTGNGFVIIMKGIHAQGLSLTLIQLHTGGDDHLLHLAAEYLQILCVVIVSAAFIISHGDEALKAQLLCHSGSELYQTVIDLVDLR